MRIAVNCQMLVKDKLEGLGYFTLETLSRIIKLHPEHEFLLIFGKGIDPGFVFGPNVKTVNIGPPFFRPITWFAKFQFFLPLYLKTQKFDLFLSTDGWLPAGLKSKSVIVVHDINFVHFPEFLPFDFRLYFQRYFKKWIKKATRIVTVSAYSKNDIAATYGISKNNITVAYNGANPVYKPVSIETKDRVMQKFTSGNPFFMFVGAMHPRKNLINLFKAFEVFKKTDIKDTHLVIVGERFYWDKKTEQTFNELSSKKHIVFTGRLSQEELCEVMGSALALTYVSFFEGFGIPLVEAMNCGTAIITSNTTSMPEIAGKAALLVDPYSVDDISQAMQRIANDELLRQQLIYEGSIRKLDFRWDYTAQKLWEVVEEVLALNNRPA